MTSVLTLTLLENGRCADMSDRFLPTAGTTSQRTKAICFGCRVRADCLRAALEFRSEHGIWGGTQRKERLAMFERIKAGESIESVVAEAMRR